MENILIFVIVMAVIGIRAIIEKKAGEPEAPAQPDLSDMEMPELHYPDTQPEKTQPAWQMQPVEEPQFPPKRRRRYSPLPEEGVRTTTPFASEAAHTSWQKERTATRQKACATQQPIRTSPPLDTPTEAGCAYADPSPEELRRAVIWSEILQRKY